MLEQLNSEQGWAGDELDKFNKYIFVVLNRFKDPEKAQLYLNRALALCSEHMDWEAHETLSLTKTIILNKIEGPKAASAWAEEVIDFYEERRLYPPSNLLLMRAKILQKAGHFARAANDFKKSFDQHEYDGAMIGILRNLAYAGSKTAFLEYAQTALEKWPNNATITFWGARAYFENGDTNKARELFKQCVFSKTNQQKLKELANDLAGSIEDMMNDYPELTFCTDALNECAPISEPIETEDLEWIYGP